MNNIEICKLKNEHIKDVITISVLSFHTPWSEASFEKEVNENRFAKYFVAKQGDVIIGFGGLWIIVDEGHITNIAVHPEYRGTGIGNMLLEALIQLCKDEMIDSMTLEVRASNLPAQGLYKKHGFIEEGIRKRYYEDNKEDAVIMWKRGILKE